MSPVAREWVDKAEADYAAALLLRRSRRKHRRDDTCSLLAQCLAKYLKASINATGAAIPDTGDLEALITHLQVARLELHKLPVEPLWALIHPSLATLNNFAAEIHSKGRTVSPTEFSKLLRDAIHVRTLLRRNLGLRD